MALLLAGLAARAYPKLPQSSPASDQTLLAQAHAAEEHRQYLAAAKIYKAYLQDHPDRADTLQRLGLVYYLSGRFNEAIPPLTRALKLDPSLWGSALFLGISYYRTGHFGQAASLLRSTLRLKPSLAEAEYWLGAALLAQGQPEQAIPYLQRGSRNPQTALEADSLLVQAYRKTAVTYYERIAKLDPNSAEVHELKAQALAWKGLVSQALQEYQEALQRSPQREGIRRAMGELYWQRHEFDTAAHEFEAELHINPLDTECNRLLGEYWLAKQEPAHAINYLHAALRSDPSAAGEVYHFLGLAELAQNNLAQAETALKRAIEQDPQQPSNYLLLIQVYRRMGNIAQAQREEAQLQKLAPGRSGPSN